MRRFYKAASKAPVEGAFAVLLDGRPVKTPARHGLELPSPALADAIVAEWEAQGEVILPRSMPLTGLANAAIDRVAPEPEAFAAVLAAYGGSDLLCYRAEGPGALVQRQAGHWDPLLEWARRRFDVDFEIVCGVMHRPQPVRTVDQLSRAVAARNFFELAAMAPLVTISGSLVITLALVENTIGLDAAWDAATVDEAWQAERWGEDAEAAATLAGRRREFEAAYLFLSLL